MIIKYRLAIASNSSFHPFYDFVNSKCTYIIQTEHQSNFSEHLEIMKFYTFLLFSWQRRQFWKFQTQKLFLQFNIHIKFHIISSILKFWYFCCAHVHNFLNLMTGAAFRHTTDHNIKVSPGYAFYCKKENATLMV